MSRLRLITMVVEFLELVEMCVVDLQRMQLDIILTSLQDHTHVASLLGYSSPPDGPEVLSSGAGFTASPDPSYGTATGPPDTHLAEILMKTLLRNLGFYTVTTPLIVFGSARWGGVL